MASERGKYSFLFCFKIFIYKSRIWMYFIGSLKDFNRVRGYNRGKDFLHKEANMSLYK